MQSSELGQMLLVGVPGTRLDGPTATLFRSLQPGGFILFGRNVESPAQLRQLIDDLRDLSEIEPIICIDEEGGRVSRLKLIGHEPPSALQLRRRGNDNLVRLHGELTGELLRLFGFNLDLCPVLDISFDDDADNSLRGRCYGTTVEEVTRFAGQFNTGLLSRGVLSCGKHFPGYAGAGLDPHHYLPEIQRSREDLERVELAIFRAFVDRVSSVMVGHGWYPTLDPARGPASLSRTVVHDLLKEEMKFPGLIMTDDLDMGAVINETGFHEMIEQAVGAGADLVMLCHRVGLIEAAHGVLQSLPGCQIEPALAAVARFKQQLSPPTNFAESVFQSIEEQIWKLRVAVMGEEAAAQRSPEDGKRSPVEMY